MSDPSPSISRLVAVKKEVFSKPYAPVKKEMMEADQLMQQSMEHLNTMNLKSELVSNPEVAESEDDDDVPYLSGKPFFDVVLGQSHVSQSPLMQLPRRIHNELPSATVPAVLRHGGKTWNMTYLGDRANRRFDNNWKKFVTDNNLKEGDALVFELMECSNMLLKFKVHILRGDIPRELQATFDTSGSLENPITID